MKRFVIFIDLVSGRFDILLAYEPSEQAKLYAKENGFKWEMTPIGRDALVFIANKSNPVDGISDADIRGIYSGKIKNWKEIGGNDSLIIPYQRNPDSGSQTLFDKLVGLGGDLMYNWICSEQGRELAERENYVAL